MHVLIRKTIVFDMWDAVNSEFDARESRKLHKPGKNA